METAFVKAMAAVSPFVRATASALTSAGRSLAVLPIPSVEPLKSSVQVSLSEKEKPNVSKNSFVAPTATVEGLVRVNDAASVWYGATISGKGRFGISIGEGSVIGDNASIVGETSIGEDTLIGPNATLLEVTVISPGAVLEPGVLIHKGVSIGSEARIAAGSIVAPDSIIGACEYWAGSPATFERALTEAELAAAKAEIIEIRELASSHALECSKDYLTIMNDLEEDEDRRFRDPDYFQRDLHTDTDSVRGIAVPGRIMNSPIRTNN
mmetsp:Transcript_23210/g.30039  ORF Transcript_23210/g.30039 Transcript_23210/m.30039 type:complete len:267 (-) Transcript_23210:366-1166(-)|eukprot:CAMPEP_0197286434 /NCGR_PEP_ID=MMETSP0890-20130614/1847_1 /TAXON_ID=44058 ORGANISM="Aureoumbra lagunensis, Strain CCMP1510" /NCGR_SAMPLE_ID=MMETSP0890 /ASSEMBLY_ACC=CAM_ASM_000533 /LENGTH=266 /DNA_ID=CAMNT_0042754743 /DNA_START=15 /DNA_END=815 /DNA_ORIENTATION=+